MRRSGLSLAGVCLCALAAPGSATAEDIRGRWYFGGSLSYQTTTDDIRSNAALFAGPFGDDGQPGTGDPNEALTCTDTGAFCDPRPDFLLGREATIEDGLRLDLTAGFGISRRISMQLDASWYSGEAGPLDVFLSEVFVIGTTGSVGLQARELSLPTPIGTVTEVPVSLSGIIRFRPDSHLNPYLGAGAGMIFTRLDPDPDLARMADRLDSQRIRSKTDEFGIAGRSLVTQGADTVSGRVPLAPHLIEYELDDAREWHLTGGLEYFMSARVSLVLDLRYTFADRSLVITLGGEDQIDLVTFPEPMFRPGGSLRYFNDLARPPNPLCSESPDPATDVRFGCFSSNGPPDPMTGESTLVPIPGARVRCVPGSPSQSDFDGDGNPGGGQDVCYGLGLFVNNQVRPGALEPMGEVVVQGGEIDLTGFSMALGLRVHF